MKKINSLIQNYKSLAIPLAALLYIILNASLALGQTTTPISLDLSKFVISFLGLGIGYEATYTTPVSATEPFGITTYVSTNGFTAMTQAGGSIIISDRAPQSSGGGIDGVGVSAQNAASSIFTVTLHYQINGVSLRPPLGDCTIQDPITTNSSDITFAADETITLTSFQLVTCTISNPGAIGELIVSSITINAGSTPPPPTTGLTLSVQMLDGSENPIGNQVGPNPIQNGNTLTLPLGGLADIRLQDSAGIPVPATYSLSGGPVFSGSVDQVNGLYINQLALLINSSVIVVDQEVVPVHLGIQTLIITPQDSVKYAPVSINLNVVRPSNVGSGIYDCTYTRYDGTVIDTQYSNCDDLVIDQASAEGLPPQYIKAEIWQESYKHKFIKTSYRYEPTKDKLVRNNQLKFPNQKLPIPKIANSKVYQNYYFNATNMSPGLSEDDIHLRSIYSYVLADGKTTARIPDNYETSFLGIAYKPLLVSDILNADYLEGDPQKWLKGNSPPAANFIAQTSIIASYGIMQLRYTTASVDLNYRTNGIGLNPSGLFRPSTNVNLGATYLSKQFIRINKLDSHPVQSFSTLTSYLYALQDASAGYNGGTGFWRTEKAINYSFSVLNQTSEYWITQLPVIGN